MYSYFLEGMLATEKLTLMLLIKKPGGQNKYFSLFAQPFFSMGPHGPQSFILFDFFD